MDNTFCLAWPIFVLMDIDVIFSYHTSTGKSPLTITGVTRVTFRARLRLMITHFGKENVFSKEYQLLYSTDLLVDLSEAMPEADKIHHSQDFAPLPSSEVNMAVQIILTLTDDDSSLGDFMSRSHCESSSNVAYFDSQHLPTDNAGNFPTDETMLQCYCESTDPHVNRNFVQICFDGLSILDYCEDLYPTYLIDRYNSRPQSMPGFCNSSILNELLDDSQSL